MDKNPDNPPALSHLDDTGQARMVDVSGKPPTGRQAVATARVRMAPAVLRQALEGNTPKGEVLGTARIAAIQAAKKTADLIPLCHPLPIDGIDVAFEQTRDNELLITCTVRSHARTGVEMEALTAASVAALTVYDMTKAADKAIEIGPIRLEHKSGGAGGDFNRR